eukprot:1815042-Amphidinium_carterae.1
MQSPGCQETGTGMLQRKPTHAVAADAPAVGEEDAEPSKQTGSRRKLARHGLSQGTRDDGQALIRPAAKARATGSGSTES